MGNFDYYGNQNQGFTSYNPPMSNQNSGQYGGFQRSSKIYVISLEDAMSRYAPNNSLMVYTLQDESMEFEIATDSQGRKMYKAYDRVPHVDQPKVQYATMEQLKQLEQRIEALSVQAKEGKKDE